MNPYIKIRHHVAQVGKLLVEGPFSIKPPPSIDDYGWLECQLRLTHWSGGVAESAAVYVDDSTNREEDFLAPVIRHVRWAKGEDLRRATSGELAWPTAAVTLSHFENSRAEVDALVRDFLGRLGALPLVPFGLSVDRSVPEVPADNRGRVLAFATNGLQSVEFEAQTSGEDNGLADAVLGGIARLRELLRPIDLSAGWRESYSYAITSADLGASRWWDYQAPTDIAPSA